MRVFVSLILLGLAMADKHRSKRFLIFPPTSPTRMQIIAGIGVPLGLEYESVTFGWVFKVEYFLADNTTLILNAARDPFNPIPHPITNRRRRDEHLAISEQLNTHDPIEDEINEIKPNSASGGHYEKYDEEAIEIDAGLTGNDESNDDLDDDDWDDDTADEYTAADYRVAQSNNLAASRWNLFKSIETLAERQGLAGRPCMLRSICESAHAPFTYSSGILGELMHIIMTPSVTKDTINDHSQNEYLRAEELGKSGAPCQKVFPECNRSFLEKFTGIYSTMENIIKIFG